MELSIEITNTVSLTRPFPSLPTNNDQKTEKPEYNQNSTPSTLQPK